MPADVSVLSGEPFSLSSHELERRMAALHGFHVELEHTRAHARERARILKAAHRVLEMYEANFAGGAKEHPPEEVRPRADRAAAG